MTPEGKIKKLVGGLLKTYLPGTYYFMPVPGGYGESTLDYIGCHCGLFFAVETKAPGGDLTALQKQIRSRIQRAGGVVFRVSCEEELDRFSGWLQTMKALDDDPDFRKA